MINTEDAHKIADLIKPLSYDQIWYVLTLANKDPRKIPGITNESSISESIDPGISDRLDSIDKSLKGLKKAVYGNKKGKEL